MYSYSKPFNNIPHVPLCNIPTYSSHPIPSHSIPSHSIPFHTHLLWITKKIKLRITTRQHRKASLRRSSHCIHTLPPLRITICHLQIRFPVVCDLSTVVFLVVATALVCSVEIRESGVADLERSFGVGALRYRRGRGADG